MRWSSLGNAFLDVASLMVVNWRQVCLLLGGFLNSGLCECLIIVVTRTPSISWLDCLIICVNRPVARGDVACYQRLGI